MLFRFKVGPRGFSCHVKVYIGFLVLDTIPCRFAPAPQSIKYLRFFVLGRGAGGVGVFLALRGGDVPCDFLNPYSRV